MIRSVLFVVRGDDSFPSSRFRAHQYRAPLERLGVRVGYVRAARGWSPVRQARFLRELAAQVGHYDAVIYQKLQHPLHIRLAAAINPNVYYDFDDALWLTSSRWRFAATLRAAPHVIAGNRVLAARAALHHRHVSVVPTTVTIPGDVAPLSRHGPLRLSWIGSACNLHYLTPVRAALRELREQGIDIVLEVLTERPEASAAEPGVTVGRWSHAAEDAALRGCHVGLMPLEDDEWSRGKCACKALQYLSYGRPIITSPVGVNLELFANAPYARLATTVEDWREALLATHRERGELAARGSAGRQRVARELSVDVWAERLLTLLTPATDRRSKLRRPRETPGTSQHVG